MPRSPSPTESSNDTESPNDIQFMRLALKLARRGCGLVEPNPMVGCVIVRNCQVIGQGFHRRYGGHHAEVEALRSVGAADDAKGATAYVTLEPCCHDGKTPPCTNTLIDAGISRVVVAMPDPFPQVDGGGLRQLEEAGVDVTVGVLRSDAQDLCSPYLKRIRTGSPWVIAKWAMTIDGKIATVAGRSQWITGASSRQNVHRLRARVDAIIVGMGTVTSDDPQLTARLGSDEVSRIATRVVFCRHRVPDADSRLVQSAAEVPLLLVVDEKIDRSRLAPLQSAGAEVVNIATDDPIEMIQLGLSVLGSKGMTNVLLEAGAELIGSFFAADQIDECHVYVGPKAFGGSSGLGPIGGSGIEEISEAWQGKLQSINQFDDDFLAVYRRT